MHVNSGHDTESSVSWRRWICFINSSAPVNVQCWASNNSANKLPSALADLIKRTWNGVLCVQSRHRTNRKSSSWRTLSSHAPFVLALGRLRHDAVYSAETCNNQLTINALQLMNLFQNRLSRSPFWHSLQNNSVHWLQLVKQRNEDQTGANYVSAAEAAAWSIIPAAALASSASGPKRLHASSHALINFVRPLMICDQYWSANFVYCRNKTGETCETFSSTRLHSD